MVAHEQDLLDGDLGSFLDVEDHFVLGPLLAGDADVRVTLLVVTIEQALAHDLDRIAVERLPEQACPEFQFRTVEGLVTEEHSTTPGGQLGDVEHQDHAARL